jgi:hypothetical protein
LSFPKEAFAQPVALSFVGEVRQTDGFDGDDAPDGGILGAINDPGGPPSEFI